MIYIINNRRRRYPTGHGYQEIGGAPSYVYATLDPENKSSDIALSNENLRATKTGSDGIPSSVLATIGKTSGKHYFEIEYFITGAPNYFINGVGLVTANVNSYTGSDADSWGYQQVNGYAYHSGAFDNYGISLSSGDFLRVAYDMVNGYLWWGKNDSWIQGDPATGTSPMYTGLSGSITCMITIYKLGTYVDANLGQNSFQASVPSGYNSGIYE